MKKTEKILKSELAKIKSIRRQKWEVVPFDLERIVRVALKLLKFPGKEKNQKLASWQMVFSKLFLNSD